MSHVGTTIGHIRIEARLGSGGMGEVYLGFDPRLERRVAVKAIRPEQRLNPHVKARFLREARLLSKLGRAPGDPRRRPRSAGPLREHQGCSFTNGQHANLCEACQQPWRPAQ